jgi:hypothetical protein
MIFDRAYRHWTSGFLVEQLSLNLLHQLNSSSEGSVLELFSN